MATLNGPSNNQSTIDGTFQFKTNPNLDKKWLKANLTSALRSTNELSNLWNHLLEDNEVIELENKLSPNFTFIDESIDKSIDGGNAVTSESIFNSWLWNPIPGENFRELVKKYILQILLFLGAEEKQDCIKVLLSEQQALCHQAAENCLSVQSLKRMLFVYSRYFIALARYKKPDSLDDDNVTSNITTKTVHEVHSAVLDLKSTNVS